MRLTIDVTGERQVSRALLRFERRLEHPQPAFALLATGLAHIQGRRFASEGNGQWAPLAETTKASKAREGLSHKILEASGRLRRSLSEVGGPGNVTVITDDSLIFGTTDPKAGLHDTGTVRMPRRKLIDLSRADRRGLTKTLQEFLVGDLA